MTEDARNLVILAGSQARETRGLAARLDALGLPATVLLASEPTRGSLVPEDAVHPATPRLVARPGLSNRWRRFWTVREIVSGGEIPRPDILLVRGASMAEAGLALADRWRVPYVLWVDEYLPPGGRIRLSRGWGRAIVAASPELADDLISTAGVPRRGVSVVLPGIELDPMPAVEAAPTAGIARVPVVGTAGPLATGSGLITFLQAAQRLVSDGLDAEFVVAGRGPHEEPLRRLAARLGVADRVTFADDEAADHASFWRVLDVFCLTAVSPTTGAPLARALAHGVPSVATDVPGLAGILLDGETGLRVPRGDVEAIAAALRDLLEHPERAKALGQAGRERIARGFGVEREARELAAVLRRALDPESGIVSRPRSLRADAGPATVA